MIPQTFEEWKHCIINDCKINLTKEFAAERLSILQNPTHNETTKFRGLYGELHLQNIINWYKKI